MSATQFKTKRKLPATRRFDAGYGAVTFVASTNKEWTHVVVLRPLKDSGAMAEFSSEPIATSLVEGLKKGMTLYAA